MVPTRPPQRAVNSASGLAELPWRPRANRQRIRSRFDAAGRPGYSRPVRQSITLLALTVLATLALAEPPATFRVATYNLENYLLDPAGDRVPKPVAARAMIGQAILRLRPDVLAVQEIGPGPALQELRASLGKQGLDYPHVEHVPGWDTNVFVGVLSRFPIVARRSHTNESYLLQGRRFHVSRGFGEVDIRVGDNYQFTLLTAHLKSRRASVNADESLLRQEEARLLRARIDAILRQDPNVNLVVLGDFNDTKGSKPVRTVLGAGTSALVDTRPAERNGDEPGPGNRRLAPRNVTWTHYFGKEDSYERIDYLLISRGLAREWRKEGTYVLAMPNWGTASDHRPVVAEFIAHDQ